MRRQCRARDAVAHDRRAVDRKNERAAAVRRRVVHVRTRLQQHASGFDLPLLDGEQQRRKAADVVRQAALAACELSAHRDAALSCRCARLDIGACVEQTPDDRGVTLGDRPHERRLLVRVLGGVDVGAALEEQLNDPAVPRARGHHERSHAGRAGHRRVGSRPDQHIGHGDAAVRAGEQQRCHAVAVGGIRFGSRLDEERRDLTLVPVCRPVQGR